MNEKDVYAYAQTIFFLYRFKGHFSLAQTTHITALSISSNKLQSTPLTRSVGLKRCIWLVTVRSVYHNVWIVTTNLILLSFLVTLEFPLALTAGQTIGSLWAWHSIAAQIRCTPFCGGTLTTIVNCHIYHPSCSVH